MQVIDLNKRVAAIKNNVDEIDLLLEEYKPFILSCAQKSTGKYLRYGEDDELSIALMAFSEAINSFDHDKGSFLSFARNVIRKRLIDYFRKESRYAGNMSLDALTDEEDGEPDYTYERSRELYEQDVLTENRKLEIVQLSKELSAFGISFSDLADVSPKQERTQKICSTILAYIISRQDLVNIVKVKKYLPISEITNAIGVPRKIAERSRKYIIAVVLIATGDYQYIKEYINISVNK